MNTQKLPKTDSVQELARFWDTHDITDFDDELEEVGHSVFQHRGGITVQLEAADADTLRRLAEAHGMREAELVRQWVLERIHAG